MTTMSPMNATGSKSDRYLAILWIQDGRPVAG
jgi:hypothetical protein